MKLMPQKLEGWGYCTVKIALPYQLFLIDLPVCQTDRQKDGHVGRWVIA